MKPKRIILIRHGESEANLSKALHALKPDYTMELTANGDLQAGIAGQQLRAMVGDESVFFYISPYWRTRSTFDGIAKHFDKDKIESREEPRLREQEWGHLREVDACVREDGLRDAFSTFYYRLPDGESCADVYDRVSDFFGTLHRDFEKADFPENAVIITHGMTIRLFLMRWFHWKVEDFEEKANPKNCQMLVLERNENMRYTLLTEMKTKKVTHKYHRRLKTG